MWINRLMSDQYILKKKTKRLSDDFRRKSKKHIAVGHMTSTPTGVRDKNEATDKQISPPVATQIAVRRH